MFKKSLVHLVVLLLMNSVLSPICYAFDADDFRELIGYMVLDVTKVSGEFNGADYGKRIKLDNGQVYEFRTYSYSYAYRPTAVVFVTIYNGVYLYKLLIEDKIYDVKKVS